MKDMVSPEFLNKLRQMPESELRLITGVDDDLIKRIKSGEDLKAESMPSIGMMVSLDHTIYFHSPRDFKADEWMFTEMQTPWAGDGRGLVFQKIFRRDGKLIATCVQEVNGHNALPIVLFVLIASIGCCTLKGEYRQQIIGSQKN